MPPPPDGARRKRSGRGRAPACALTALALGWFGWLNVAAAAREVPLVVHGAPVRVVVEACDVAIRCTGAYSERGNRFVGQRLEGVPSARPGEVIAATVDGRHPGVAVAGWALGTFAEAAALALAALVVAMVCVRAAAVTLRSPRSGPPGAVGPGAPTDAAGGADDPLAWVRRRRFGAGG